MTGRPSPVGTLRRTIRPGAATGRGTDRVYRALAPGAGEPHTERVELLPAAADLPARCARRSLGVLGHLTDLQIADVQSPVRFEYLNRQLGNSAYDRIVPVHRPQETLAARAVDAMVRTLNALPGSPVTAAPLALVVTTGDAIDNAQWNELRAVLALLDGGVVHTDSGGPAYDGVQSLDWPDDRFWKPAGVAAGGPDRYRSAFGFPHWPGLVEAALAEFSAGGLAVPWLSCFGNHEGLIQGVGALTPWITAALVGDRKPVTPPADIDDTAALETFATRPERFWTRPDRPVPADGGRAAMSRREFVGAHFGVGGQPVGHGFTAANRADGTAFYVYDGLPGVRLVALDTTCLAGGGDGCVEAAQVRWLEERLIEVHSRYVGVGGESLTTGNTDALVVVFSHHGLDTLTNTRLLPAQAAEDLVGADALRRLLHRYPNVVLWLNGHTHRNLVRPRPAPTGRTGGFWEVTTSAVMDWPCQARLVELVDNADGTLSVVCTMIDHEAPLRPRRGHGDWLAALHREVAANVPELGPTPYGSGTPLDRNVDLRLPAPFRLAGLGS